MKIKDNKLIIDIPKGMEIDVKNTDLTKGIVKFKKKIKEYHDIFGALVKNLYYNSYGLETSNANKLIALDKLMNIAKYYNGDWKPEWNNRNEDKYYIYYRYITDEYLVNANFAEVSSIVYFKNEVDAQAVIDNPNFRPILDAIYKNE